MLGLATKIQYINTIKYLTKIFLIITNLYDSIMLRSFKDNMKGCVKLYAIAVSPTYDKLKETPVLDKEHIKATNINVWINHQFRKIHLLQNII